MKLATFSADGHERIGVVKSEEIVDLTGEDVPSGMIELIANWPKLEERVARIAKQTKPRYRIKDVHLLAPVPRGVTVRSGRPGPAGCSSTRFAWT